MNKEKAIIKENPMFVDKHGTAKLLNVSTKTVFRLRKRKKLIGYRISNQVMYRLQDLIDYINKSKLN